MWHFNAPWNVKNYNWNPRIWILLQVPVAGKKLRIFALGNEMDKLITSMCQGKYTRHLFLFKGNYSLDWTNRTGLAPKAGALLSSARIPLCGALCCMVQQRKGRSNSSMYWNLWGWIWHSWRDEKKCALVFGLPHDSSGQLIQRGIESRGFGLGRTSHRGCLEFWKWPVHC